MKMAKAGRKRRHIFGKHTKCRKKKIRLCTRVAENERRILESVDYNKSLSLYIGIPFCPTICLYCSFFLLSAECLGKGSGPLSGGPL